MSLAFIGRRAARYLIAFSAVAACAYAILKPEPPRVGYAQAVAGIPVNRTVPTIGGDLRLGGVVSCGAGVWDGSYSYDFQWVRDNVDLTGETAANAHRHARATSAAACAATSAPRRTPAAPSPAATRSRRRIRARSRRRG